MHVTIIGSCEIGKTLSVKREKETKPGGGTERLVCYLPVADLFVDCDTIDAFCGQPRGWARGALYHDTGEPRSKLALEIPDADWTVGGTFGGRAGEPLTLTEASMTGVVLTLTPLGALMAARFTWNTAGDEADDVAELLDLRLDISDRLTSAIADKLDERRQRMEAARKN